MCARARSRFRVHLEMSFGEESRSSGFRSGIFEFYSKQVNVGWSRELLRGFYEFYSGLGRSRHKIFKGNVLSFKTIEILFCNVF